MNTECKKKSQRVLGIDIANLSFDETVDFIIDRINKQIFTQHVVVNAGKIVSMQYDETLRQSVMDSDIINADGMAVVWASKFLGVSLPERVAGVDLMYELVYVAHLRGLRCFFFGATEEVVLALVKIFGEKYSSDIIAGYRNGYYNKGEEESIARMIGESHAHMLFVAMSSPQKEIFVNKYKHLLNVQFVMGVGGSFDIVAGKTKRAPLWMQKTGLEWFYRFIQEPRRMWKRYLYGNTKFIWLVLKAKFMKNENK